MSIVEGLLDAIRDDPADDTPRLILSDWLEDHGEPDRAELIRIQCVLARMSPEHELRPELEARERGLLLVHETEWANLPGWATGRILRGFLGAVSTPTDLLLAKPEQILGAWPVQELELIVTEFSDLEHVAQLPGLRSLRQLTIRGHHLPQAGMRALLESPALRNLEALKFIGETISRPGLRRVFTLLPNLKQLTIDCVNRFDRISNFTPVDLAAVLPTAPSSLQRLEIRNARLGLEGAEVLRRCQFLDELRDLHLVNTDLPWEALAVLGMAEFAGRLEHLNLQANPIAGSPEVFFHHDHGFRSLRQLDLTECPVAWSQEATLLFLSRPHLEALYVTDPQTAYNHGGLARWLRHSALANLHTYRQRSPGHYSRAIEDDALVAALANSHTLTHLRHLSLDAAMLPEQFGHLLGGPNAANWCSLELNGAILQEGIAALVNSRLEPKLRRLSLSNCRLTTSDATALAECPWLCDLRVLDLSYNEIGNEGARAIANSLYLKRLTSLNLTRCRITDARIFADGYLANPAILNLRDNALDGVEELLHAGVEHMRRSSLISLLPELLDDVRPPGPAS